MALAWLIIETDNAITVMVLRNIVLFFKLTFDTSGRNTVYKETLH
jgi:hypothetical protein